jgi:hypothetical protein
VAQLLERDHKVFFAAWLEHPTKPGGDGGQLFDVMRRDNIDLVKFSIIYKDGNGEPLWYRSNCVIERNVEEPGGVSVSYLGQELVRTEVNSRQNKRIVVAAIAFIFVAAAIFFGAHHWDRRPANENTQLHRTASERTGTASTDNSRRTSKS